MSGLMLAAAANTDRWEFIWASYSVFLVVFIALIVWPIVKRKQLKAHLKQYYHRKSLLENSAHETVQEPKDV